MKKILFFLAISLLVAGSVSAQGYYYGPRRAVRRPAPRSHTDEFYRIRFGLTGGVNIANTINAYNSNYTTAAIAGFNAGLTMEIPLIYPLSFAPEVLYSQKGFAAATTSDGNFTQRTNYIDVPLLAKFKLSPTFNFLIGPQLAIPVSTTQTYDNGFNITSEQNYNTYGQKTILDGVLGVSFDFNPNVELRVRYAVDLQQNSQNSADGSDYRNQVWQIGLGIKFE
ncbi:MAG: hypothetical protein JWR02_1703 [Mucilaginibacter sp.]|nr:hypothetical protein [Mucilaginibacter sp.]